MQKTERVIINHNPDIQEEYDGLKDSRREIETQLRQCTAEINQTKINVGGLAAEGCDYSEYTAKLAGLRSQVEAMELGIKHIDGQMQLKKRVHSWLK